MPTKPVLIEKKHPQLPLRTGTPSPQPDCVSTPSSCSITSEHSRPLVSTHALTASTSPPPPANMSLRSSRQRKASLASLEPPPMLPGNDSVDPRSSPRAASARPIPTSSSITDAAQTGTSYNQNRGPARSFIANSPLAAGGLAQYSSDGVRGQTAELASFAFSKPGSFKDFARGSQRDPSISPNSQDTDVTDRAKVQHWEDSVAPLLPETILETSEPASPESTNPVTPDEEHNRTLSPPHGGESALSNMFSGIRNYGTTRGSEVENPPRRKSSSTGVPRKAARDDRRNDERSALLKSKARNGTTDKHSKARTPNAAEYEESPTVGDVEDRKPFNKKRNQLQQILHEAGREAGATLSLVSNPKRWEGRTIWAKGVVEPASLLPCVFLGVLLNVLDALSYGMILFPLGEPIFANTGADGISMFYVSCIVSQLVYSWGGSIFKGAVGSEMIEVVPFFHKMTYIIMARTGTDKPNVVLATVITSYAISSILTGVVFFTLGAFRLGSLVSFFPRHILVGCIGGVGFFLFVTGIEVSARLDGNLEYTIDTLKQLFEKDTVALWIIPLALAILLRVATRLNSSPYLVPAFFISVIVVFYIVVAAVTSFNVPSAREKGWIFASVKAGVPFYHFYTYYDFAAVDWKALSATIPSMFALTFFGVLHVPINIPALGIAANEDDVNLNRELVAHGLSNALSGLSGSIQNYLVYVNSAMFINNGGNSRLAGTLLAAATFGVWVAGPTMIGYVPVMVVGALIFYLGIDLLQEAVYDTWGKMSKLEYLTVVAIVLIMGIYDFVTGILVGIVLACLNFVVQTSRKSAIRASYNGEIVESTVRRHPIQRHFLHEVGNQIYVTKLAGFLFFGSIVRVEKQSRALIEEEAFNRDPIRYLVFDLAHVDGLDYTAAEAFGRMERILARRDVRMIISGVGRDSDVGKALRNAGVWRDETGVGFFETLNNALESCENELLQAFYHRRDVLNSYSNTRRNSFDASKTESAPITTPDAPDSTLHIAANELSLAASPRQRYLEEAATTTLTSHTSTRAPKKWSSLKQPLPLILQTFQDLTPHNEDFWFHLVPYLTRHTYAAGTVVFARGHTADAFYLLETGMLRAQYSLPVGTYHESIVAGTVCGELPFFSGTPRTATVSAEMDTVAWRLSSARWEVMQREWPEGAREILKVAMKLTKERVDSVVAYVLTTAG